MGRHAELVMSWEIGAVHHQRWSADDAMAARRGREFHSGWSPAWRSGSGSAGQANTRAGSAASTIS